MFGNVDIFSFMVDCSVLDDGFGFDVKDIS
jgi:hypothetical protein